jgi:macrolide-specific efflux system membrane fusion protein
LKVRTGINNNVKVEVLAGLQEGEHVLLGDAADGEGAASGTEA